MSLKKAMSGFLVLGSMLAFSNGAHLDLLGIAHVTQGMFA